MPRRVSSGRSPAVPVVAAARPTAPAAIPSATSRIAAIPASLWAKSTMTTLAPRRNRLSRHGDRDADDVDDLGLGRAMRFHDRTVTHEVRPPPGRQVPIDGPRSGPDEAEQGDPRPDAPGDGEHQRVVRVEDDPPVRAGDPADG